MNERTIPIKSEVDELRAELAALREELAEAGRYKNLYEQSEKTLDRVHCMYAKRLLEATGERQTVLIPDEEFVKYFEEIKELKQRLTAAEQRNAELAKLLNGYPRGVPGFAAWADKVTSALKPTESGASKKAPMSLAEVAAFNDDHDNRPERED